MAEPLKYKRPTGDLDVQTVETRGPGPTQPPPEESSAYGWNPYRGTEAHGVPIEGGYPADLEETVEDTFKDREEPPREQLKRSPVVPNVKGWSEDVLVRVKATTVLIPLPNGVWVKVLEDNPRRVMARWWTDPAPQGSNPLNLTTDSDNRVATPFMLGGGINNQVNENRFTNELWLQSNGIDRTFHCIEEYEVRA